MSRSWFISDTHFSCVDTILRENRPFITTVEFDNYVIDKWNAVVKPEDIIYHLGDFITYNNHSTESWKEGLELVKRIDCKVILIIGNNEERLINSVFNGSFFDFRDYCIDLGFFDVKKDLFLDFKNTKFYLNHYPHNYQEDCINLFGHTHRATGLYKSFGLNVCCDLNFFRLFSEEEIFRLLKDKKMYWDEDIDVNLR